MGFYINDIEPLAAHRDITVRKMLLYDYSNKSYYTAFNHSHVRLNTMQCNEDDFPSLYVCSGFSNNVYCTSNELFYSYSNKGKIINFSPSSYIFTRYIVLKAYIPKGSRYYICDYLQNKDGARMYASERLFITDKVVCESHCILDRDINSNVIEFFIFFCGHPCAFLIQGQIVYHYQK